MGVAVIFAGNSEYASALALAIFSEKEQRKLMMKLAVKVTDIYYPKATEKGNWYAINTDCGKGKRQNGMEAEPGELLILDGKYGVYKGSRCFDFTSAMPNVPIDPRAQLKYVADRNKRNRAKARTGDLGREGLRMGKRNARRC